MATQSRHGRMLHKALSPGIYDFHGAHPRPFAMGNALAKRRRADEYDAAQDRGEVAANGQRTTALPEGKSLASVVDLGLTHKQVHEARQLRDAEKAEPGIVRRAQGHLCLLNSLSTATSIASGTPPA